MTQEFTSVQIIKRVLFVSIHILKNGNVEYPAVLLLIRLLKCQMQRKKKDFLSLQFDSGLPFEVLCSLAQTHPLCNWPSVHSDQTEHSQSALESEPMRNKEHLCMYSFATSLIEISTSSAELTTTHSYGNIS